MSGEWRWSENSWWGDKYDQDTLYKILKELIFLYELFMWLLISCSGPASQGKLTLFTLRVIMPVFSSTSLPLGRENLRGNYTATYPWEYLKMKWEINRSLDCLCAFTVKDKLCIRPTCLPHWTLELQSSSTCQTIPVPMIHSSQMTLSPWEFKRNDCLRWVSHQSTSISLHYWHLSIPLSPWGLAAPDLEHSDSSLFPTQITAVSSWVGCFPSLLYVIKLYTCTLLFPGGQLVTCDSLPRLQTAHWNKSSTSRATKNLTVSSALISPQNWRVVLAQISIDFPLWCLVDSLPLAGRSLYHCGSHHLYL